MTAFGCTASEQGCLARMSDFLWEQVGTVGTNVCFERDEMFPRLRKRWEHSGNTGNRHSRKPLFPPCSHSKAVAVGTVELLTEQTVSQVCSHVPSVPTENEVEKLCPC